ncbi:MAG TPA: hypothetical protein PKC72_07390 [Chitinophagaceae bacterium]|nr:hypothetical protein [Chitinophagaceae bacterium]
MSDKLKQFIDQNRDNFDSTEPDPQLFNSILDGIEGKKETGKTLVVSMRQVAAAVVAIIALSAILYFIFRTKEAPGMVQTNPGTPQDEEYVSKIADPIYAKQIDHFQELIGFQQSELKQLKNEYPQLYHQFVNDIDELDSSYQKLKLKLANNPNRELLLEAMIQNLQLQSELLNRQLIIIKEIKQKSKNHEKNSV